VVSGATPVSGTTVRIGGVNATVTFSGLTATGLFQANVIVPALAAGDHAVTLSVSGVANLATGVLPVR
jgi:uncharacterized protein (TIGR03437 family)